MIKNQIIHNKLDSLQFNSSIEYSKFLIVKIPYIGYGGQLSMRIFGMKLAYFFNRTVIFDDIKNPYINCYEQTSIFSIKDIECFSSVKLKLYERQDEKVVYLDFDEYWLNLKNRNYFNDWVPEELRNQNINKNSFNGQLMLRFKLLPEYLEYVETKKNKMGFSKPIIGVHIRRGDKKNESSYVPMRIYNHYIKKAVKETGIKKIFVTSDNDNIFSELPQDFGLEYIYDTEEKRYNNANHEFLTSNPELKKQETLTAIKIVELLSECDCLVGQINTHFTTLARDLGLIKSNSKSKIYFVNKDIIDVYINNDPNIILFILDLFRKYSHLILILIIRKIKPFIFKNEIIYKKLKKIYYGEER